LSTAFFVPPDAARLLPSAERPDRARGAAPSARRERVALAEREREPEPDEDEEELRPELERVARGVEPARSPPSALSA
jgi:hypothetical protein